MRRTTRIALAGIPIGAISMLIVAGVNLLLFLRNVDQGADPIGYANASIIALFWAFAMIWGTETDQQENSE